MPSVVSTGIALPRYVFHQADIKPFIRDMFAGVFPDIDRLMTLFENTQIQKRHFCVDINWFKDNHTFAEKNSLYLEQATELCVQAIEKALEQAGIGIDDISHVIFVSSTGLATPSVDARILNQIKANPLTKRTPIWGLGCGGGAAGVSKAYDYVKAHPKEMAIVVAVELCGLTFQRNDLTKSNLVATSLFADGAAAVIVAGDEAKVSSFLRIKETQSMLWHDTLDVMGWDFSSSGFHVIFSQDIPTIVKTKVADATFQFLQQHGYTEVDHYLLHPGGRKVLEAYRDSLGIEEQKLDISSEIIQQYGNMSSCTVLYVLDEFLRQGRITEGQSGLMAALGPGFSLEMLLVEGVGR